MANKIAILIDGGFFIRTFKEKQSRFPRIRDMPLFIDDIIARVQNISKAETDILFRSFYYDCRPYGETQKDPNGKLVDFSVSPQFRASTQFHRDLKLFPQMALRLGDLSFDGWKINPGSNKYIPDFKQKSVDIKMGLDIAWLATKKIVDKLVVVAGDSDFITPMKFARKEGLLIYLDCMKQSQIKLSLKEHADFLL